MTKKQEIEALYKKLIESRFAFVGHGERKLSDIYSAVEQKFPALCNKHYRCSESCSKGRSSELRWMHATRTALSNLKVRGWAQKAGHGIWILNGRSSRKKKLGDRKDTKSRVAATEAVFNSRQAAGFGATEDNNRVEQAAIRRVARHYKGLGWEVLDVSNENRGYDLLCEKGAAKRHVEVKGASGGAERFIITAREANVWKSDSRYILALVRNALTRNSSVAEFVGSAGRSAFMFQPIAYWAIRNGRTARRGGRT